MKRRLLWKRIWHIAAATGIFGLVTRSVWEIATTEARLFNWITALFRGFLSIRVPLWAAIAVSLAAVLVLLTIGYLSGRSDKKAPWEDFTTMDYDRWTFCWVYPNVRRSIYPICKKCDCDLSVYNNGYSNEYLYCPNCLNRFPLLAKNTLSDAEEVILSKIRNWPKTPK